VGEVFVVTGPHSDQNLADDRQRQVLEPSMRPGNLSGESVRRWR
jgi:hypothetical protein